MEESEPTNPAAGQTFKLPENYPVTPRLEELPAKPVFDDPAPKPAVNPWNAGVAAKKVTWAVSKIIAAKIAAAPLIDPVCGYVNNLGDNLQPYGFYMHADASVIAKGLPLLIFAGLVLAHDAAKTKKGFKWPWL